MRTTQVKTTCSYCGVGCGIIASSNDRGQLSVTGDPDHPVNKGMLCSKGRNLNYVVQDQTDRLLYPQMRLHRSHPLQRVTWEKAMLRAAAVFRSIIDKHGPDSVGFYVSGQCLTEEYYLVNKLAKGFIGTNNIDTNSRLCMSSAVIAYAKMLGEDTVPVSYEDLEQTDCLFVAGANPAWCHPIIWRRVEAHKTANPQVKIIVADPRKTDTCAIADLHLQLIPGTDVILYNAIARRLYDTGRIDKGFIRDHTEAEENYFRILKDINLRKAAKQCGVPLNDIKLAAEYIGNAKAFMTMWAMGLNQSKVGVEKNGALINLHLLTGQIGRPGAGPFSLTGQPNAMGGREVGGMASLLAAHRVLANASHRDEIARFWGVDSLPEHPGLTATQMFDALESGKLKAVWVICTNPVVSMPNVNQVVRALKKAKFVVVQDISARAETVEYADLVLPAAGWLEKTGTMTNAERRVSLLQPLASPPGEARPDADILCDFARHMGFTGFSYQNVSEVYDEYVRMTAGTNIDVTGLSHQRLKKEGSFQWPVPTPDHPGTPRLFGDHQFYTNTRRARFFSTSSQRQGLPAPPEGKPYILTTGRLRDQWHTMTRTGKVSRLLRHQSRPLLEIHPVDAFELELADDQLAEITSEYGVVRARIKYSKAIRKGVVFLPMHWGKTLNSPLTRVNNLTDDKIDPYSKQPNFKFTYVSIRPYRKPRERIAVIGAGAAAYRFVASYRKLNPYDYITVYSKEANAFYNRVLLPEYVSDHLEWGNLEKMTDSKRQSLNIELKTNCPIEHIDRKEKRIVGTNGETYSYDRLIIATGSRPFIPREVPKDIPGVFKMRRREDADALKTHLGLGQSQPAASRRPHVLIVGGGLLGLELAAALKMAQARITIVQRSNRLMERQLDATSSHLLAQEVNARGIQVYFRNEVETVFERPTGKGLRVTFKSGKVTDCDAIVYAIGTRPNLELGRSAGLNCGRGIAVNDRLCTSDPAIYAIGEVAEWKGKRFGITAAAEQQADVLAAYIAGDPGVFYQDSTLMNILKFDNFDLCSIGEINYPPDDPSYEEIVFRDTSQGYYKKCIVRNDRLIGAILLGDKNEFAEFRELIEERIELSEKRQELLRSASTKEPLVGRLVCSCNNVGEGNIVAAIGEGSTSLTALCKATGGGLGCGSCKPEIQQILEDQSVSLK
ncbi:molybdopterin-dependent oxidoreductase [Neolewinella aurantiaca]|uniref:Molybdopterin-dependent oxidoreductase n=1 Tax=Neolewinella aurantiaca TaxID=2602767 RepID=A0A5C7FLJ9_9BACT|nr:nitrate reductase [Neolewinella aurantiaca]TXF90889.1 molybdopterin-dependent oxidoreductase [Neolewinella aurantiaca]